MLPQLNPYPTIDVGQGLAPHETKNASQAEDVLSLFGNIILCLP